VTVLFVLVPMALVLAGGAVLAFLWAANDGQMDDLTTPAIRILHDEGPEASPLPPSAEQNAQPGAGGDRHHP